MSRSRQTYRHEALLWADTEDFLAGTVPFITEGLDADEPVMVAVIKERTDVLRDALGDRAEEVRFVDMGRIGKNPARIIPAWQEFLSAHAGDNRPLRGIGEPIWAGRGPEEIVECQLHEALLNIAVDPKVPFWLLCPYDTGRLDGSVIEEAHRSHPAVVDSQVYRGSSHYGGRTHVDLMFGSELPSIPGDPREVNYTRDSVDSLFAFVAVVAYTAGLSADRAAGLAVAVRDLALDTLDHGVSSGVVRAWPRSNGVIVELRDPAPILDPLAGRRTPALDRFDSLWSANQSCDLVQVRTAPDGTTIRLHHRI